jgi:hypothetical protein
MRSPKYSKGNRKTCTRIVPKTVMRIMKLEVNASIILNLSEVRILRERQLYDNPEWRGNED